MNYFKIFIVISFTVLIGIFIGTYIYKASNITNSEAKDVFNENVKIYLLQTGVYSTKESMEENSNDLSDYFYFKDKDGYHVIIGVVENKENIKKIGDSFKLRENNIYMKEVIVNNMEFLESLRQYDILVDSMTDSQGIINAEKQILSKYEELIINNE